MVKRKHSPITSIVLSFLIVILIGTIFLLLPISLKEGQHISFVDALFTSVSAVCVTGLVPVPSIAETFNVFGKIVLAILMQVGGLGFVTIAIFILVAFGARVGIANRYLAKEALNQSSTSGIVKLIILVIKTTFTIEFIGFILNFIVFIQDYTFWDAVGVSLFHSISAFNNCGMDIIGAESLLKYKDSILLNISTTLMIILGGLGFVVLQDIKEKKNWKKLLPHSKIVITVTLSLIVGGTLMLKFSEWGNISWLQAFFQSVSSRTAGFSTMTFASIRESTACIFIFLMFVGASPSSTGGGIKTTTFYTMVKSIFAFATGKKALTYNRKISEDTKLRAFTLATIALSAIGFATTLILLIEKDSSIFNLRTVFFEVTSAFGTVGLSLGITSQLSYASKLILCLVMFLGRLGPLTIFSLWNKNWNRFCEDDDVDYIPAKIIIG